MPETFVVGQQTFQVSLPVAAVERFSVRSVPRPYDVDWIDGQNGLTPSALVAREFESAKSSVLLADERVFALYCKGLESLFGERCLLVPATEEFKTLDGALRVVDFLNKHNITKGDGLLVLGGGIVQDVGAFAAAIFKRGIPWVFIPTTLLSQADSGIGGKTGLNYKIAKNQLALFSAPRRVIIHPGFLKTLAADDFLSGMGEVLKLHLLGGPRFFKNYCAHRRAAIESQDQDALRELIQGALMVKRAVIEVDEFELDHRRSMNYGHTFGHAIEAMSDFAIPHGSAVALGILLANRLSFSRSLLSKAELEAIEPLCLELVSARALNLLNTFDFGKLSELFKKDKKTVGNAVNFILLETVGKSRVESIKLSPSLLTEIKDLFGQGFGDQ